MTAMTQFSGDHSRAASIHGGRRPCPAVALLAACVAALLATGVGATPPPTPAQPGAPLSGLPHAAVPEQSSHFELPENWRQIAASLSLADIIDIALSNNEDTRGAWFSAKSAAADLGSKRSEYYPTVDLSLDLNRDKVSAVGGLFKFQQTTYGPSLAINYLLFDFGGRPARVAQARDALLSADWQNNAIIQNVILEVQQAYFSYLDTKSQLAASDADIKELETNLEAAQKRHEVGVATIADVLQAKTALSQAKLIRQQQAGSLQTLRGGLATSMGIPANTPFEVGNLPATLPLGELSAEIAPLIEKALANRPDLAAARWDAEKATDKIRDIRSQGLPSVSATASGNRVYYVPAPAPPASKYADNWSLALNVSIPLFAGGQYSYNTRKAEADAQVSRSTAAKLEQQVILDVWTAYAGMETAAQQVKTAADLLASAEESAKVARGRYKEGVGSILDLLTAQSSLATARSSEISARTNWLLAASQLAHATGTLSPAQSANINVGGK